MDTFTYQQRVYFSDTDAGGIVYHARYLDFTEHARTELLRRIGGEQQENIEQQRIGFVVSSVTLDYKKPAFLDDLLEVTTRVIKCERFSMVLEQDVLRGEELAARQRTRLGFVDLDKKRPVPIPEKWRESFNRMISDEQ
jgi:acyl-CoA thioester hydrolase